MRTLSIISNVGSNQQIKKIFKNSFGHFRAVWRIFFYITFLLILFKLVDLLGDSFLSFQGENLSDYELVVNRFVSKFIKFISVCIPAIVLLKWVDKRPLTLLGMGFYKEIIRELSIGMLMTFILMTLCALILYFTGVASFSYNGFSIGLFFYMLSVLFVLIISACFEEVLFRGYIFQSLIEGSNFWIALGVYSLLFGAAHLNNEEVTVYSIAVTILAGALLGTIYYKTRALWMCIGAHFMWNWMLGPFFGLAKSKFLRRNLFTYHPAELDFILGADDINEIIIGILCLVLTIYIWKAKWLKPAEYNRNLWSKYPNKYGTEPLINE
ncbi:lysostaphin resistance A-like protein [Bacteroidota bacterium]